jgi:hypothetical protein
VSQIGMFHMLISDRIVGGGPWCQVIYFAYDNTVALINDEGTAFVAPGKAPLGAPYVLANAHCSVNVAAMTRVATNTTVRVTYPLKLNVLTFAGEKRLYLNTFDLGGALSHWVQAGTITVQ